MNFKEAADYLYSLGNEMQAMKLGLESIGMLAGRFEHPERKFPSVHIAGTNGKGSTAAMVDAILRAGKWRTGFYSSPHLVSITERIRIDGQAISEGEFALLATRVRETSERLVTMKQLESVPTFFEQVTMIAFLFFAGRNVDLAVLEVGMGGRLDATNICRPVVTAITPIGFDHQHCLGDTLTAIAGEKAGILKPGIPAVIAPMKGEAIAAVTARADVVEAPVILVEDEVRAADLLRIEVVSGTEALRHTGKCYLGYRNSRAEYAAWINLRGRHQAINALTAIHIAEEVKRAGFGIPLGAVNQGLSEVVWPGRLEIVDPINGNPAMLLDGAHNLSGAVTLRAFLDEHFSDRQITMIFGVMRDKEVGSMAELLFPAARRIILTRVDNPRTVDPADIAAPDEVVRIGSAAEALTAARQATSRDGLIVICGSLYLIGEIKALLNPPTASRV